jgi:long-chain acyl-CoA synthetase
MRSHDETIGGLLRTSAARRRGRSAVRIVGGEHLSYERLEALAAAGASGLARLGVRPGDRVVLHLANSADWVMAYYALARRGAVVAPANILLTPPEVAFIAEDCGAVAAILPASRPGVCALLQERLPGLKLILADDCGEIDEAQTIAFEDLFDAPAYSGPAPGPDDLFTIGYTSGTTGRPKGAMLTHRSIFRSAAQTAEIHERREDDVIVSGLPFSHVYGNIVLNSALMVGARLVALPRFDAETALKTIARERATLFEGVPTMYYQMLAHPRLGAVDLGSLRRCTVGGQTMPTTLMEEVATRFACPLLELWGMTELAGPVTSHSSDWPTRFGSIGRPFPGTSVRIVDPSSRSCVTPGESGELQVRGPLVMLGYWGAPKATAEALDPGGWFSTGDLARQDEDGFLYVVDRLKDMIITAGYNIYPTEVEQAVASHPAVGMVAVAPVPDPEKGELPVAYVVVRDGAQVSADDILAHCRGRLAAYKIPRHVAFVADLPKTSTGKIRRAALREFALQLEGEPS